ncbi:DRTGG domain-containing protein [Cellulosilyticum sp. I15G10I2]|uniref:DRTGG domain-containing protein n=1 Tax=Cellulosilyticum sp. I15G10I2 TaxID=1892843 RepID=UPI00085BEC28|nr:DRTGG domain-containing protein [Cellulosilyticum sp. I15G10I2]
MINKKGLNKVIVKDIIEQIQLKLVAGEAGITNQVQGGYVGDLLSFVMSHAKEKDVWITIQGHINSVAVASLLGLSAIILTENVEADEAMIHKANEEGIPVLSTKLNSFDVVCQLACLSQIQEI